MNVLKKRKGKMRQNDNEVHPAMHAHCYVYGSHKQVIAQQMNLAVPTVPFFFLNNPMLFSTLGVSEVPFLVN